MFDVRAKQQLNRGYSDGMTRGLEIVLTPLLMGALGLLLDGWFGTGRVLAIVFGILGVVGIAYKLWSGYDRQMVVEETGKPWARGADNAPAPEATP